MAKVLSLFDGMANGMLAMIESGIEVERYVAFEYDEESANAQKGRPYGWAALTASHNFPFIEQRGDVFKADFTEFEGFDWLVGGSPCTYWSIAQKNNRETEASGMGWELFQQYVRALHEAKPLYFIYENNKSMAKAIRASIDEAFGFEAVEINSALLSAQNRQRLYWVGRRNEDGTYSKVTVPLPEDRGILLKDILEYGCCVDKDKAYCLKHQAGNARDYFKKHHIQIKFEPLNTTPEGKSQTIKAQYQNTSAVNICCYKSTYGASGVGEPVRVGCMPSPDGEVKNGQAMQVYDSVAESLPCFATPTEWDENGRPTKARSCADGKIYTVYEVKDGKITIKDKEYPIKLPDGFYIIRKLTVRECMRLQTVPEWYEFPVSDSQAYKMLGNGWTVLVISHLINCVMSGKTDDVGKQITLDL